MVSCDVAAENRIARTAKEELVTLVTQHLLGASLMVAPKNNGSERDMRIALLVPGCLVEAGDLRR